MCNYSLIINGGNWQSTPLAEESLTVSGLPPPMIYTQGGSWFMRPIQEPWGVTPGHSQVFSLAVSHLQEGLLSCQRATLHSSVTRENHTLLLVLLACGAWSSHTGLSGNCRWSPRIEMDGKKQAWRGKRRPSVVETRALNFKLRAMESH